MDLQLNGGQGLFLLFPLISWAVGLYFILRFLRAFERGVRAHERIADGMSSRAPGTHAGGAFDERGPDLR